jgi:hypothetical protein
MIEELTEERLEEIGIEDQTSTICFRISSSGSYAVHRGENKIYSDSDALRLYYFRENFKPSFPLLDMDLVPEYFKLSSGIFLLEQKKLAKAVYNEKRAVEMFIDDELSRTYRSLEVNINTIKRLGPNVGYAVKDQDKYNHYIGWLNDLKVKLESNSSSINDLLDEFSGTEAGTEENDFTKSTIEDWFYPFKDMLSNSDYGTLVNAYYKYCKTSEFPEGIKFIQFRGKVNKKILGWAIHEILSAHNKRITPEVLKFSQLNLSVYQDETFENDRYQRSNIYKYHSTKAK